MSGLKELRNRIKSIKSTQKITKAMQLVAASKLRKAKMKADSSNASLVGIKQMIKNVACNIDNINIDLQEDKLSKIIDINSIKDSMNNVQKSRDIISNSISDKKLIIICSSQRGLCGGFNINVIKHFEAYVKEHYNNNKNNLKNLKLIIIGNKAYAALKDKYAENIDNFYDMDKNYIEDISILIQRRILTLFENGEIDSCDIYFNEFKNALTQDFVKNSILPMQISNQGENQSENINNKEENDNISEDKYYEYENFENIDGKSSNTNLNDSNAAKNATNNSASNKNMLSSILNIYIKYTINNALINNNAGEEGARMTAMDNATRNASDLIDSLTLKLNRSRQAIITTELTEIISGSEALS